MKKKQTKPIQPKTTDAASGTEHCERDNKMLMALRAVPDFIFSCLLTKASKSRVVTLVSHHTTTLAAVIFLFIQQFMNH
jgi:hypothetical protein